MSDEEIQTGETQVDDEKIFEEETPASPPEVKTDEDKDAKISELTQQITEMRAEQKADRIRREAQEAFTVVGEKYPNADKNILKEALDSGKHANEINQLAKVMDRAVGNKLENAEKQSREKAEADVAERFGTIPTGGTAAGEPITGRDLQNLSPKEQVEAMEKGRVKRADRTKF